MLSKMDRLNEMMLDCRHFDVHQRAVLLEMFRLALEPGLAVAELERLRAFAKAARPLARHLEENKHYNRIHATEQNFLDAFAAIDPSEPEPEPEPEPEAREFKAGDWVIDTEDGYICKLITNDITENFARFNRHLTSIELRVEKRRTGAIVRRAFEKTVIEGPVNGASTNGARISIRSHNWYRIDDCELIALAPEAAPDEKEGDA